MPLLKVDLGAKADKSLFSTEQKRLLDLAKLALYRVDQERIHQPEYKVHSNTHLSEEIAVGQKPNPAVMKVGSDGELLSPLLPFVEYVIEATVSIQNGKAIPTIKTVPRTYLARSERFHTASNMLSWFFNKKLDDKVFFERQIADNKKSLEKLYYHKDHLHAKIDHQSPSNPYHLSKYKKSIK